VCTAIAGEENQTVPAAILSLGSPEPDADAFDLPVERYIVGVALNASRTAERCLSPARLEQ
jgi:hypothetical protein